MIELSETDIEAIAENRVTEINDNAPKVIQALPLALILSAGLSALITDLFWIPLTMMAISVVMIVRFTLRSRRMAREIKAQLLAELEDSQS